MGSDESGRGQAPSAPFSGRSPGAQGVRGAPSVPTAPWNDAKPTGPANWDTAAPVSTSSYENPGSQTRNPYANAAGTSNISSRTFENRPPQRRRIRGGAKFLVTLGVLGVVAGLLVGGFFLWGVLFVADLQDNVVMIKPGTRGTPVEGLSHMVSTVDFPEWRGDDPDVDVDAWAARIWTKEKIEAEGQWDASSNVLIVMAVLPKDVDQLSGVLDYYRELLSMYSQYQVTVDVPDAIAISFGGEVEIAFRHGDLIYRVLASLGDSVSEYDVADLAELQYQHLQRTE